jgi:hypothetical protein
MSRMQVEVDVHESLVNKIKAGQKAIVRVDAFPEYSLEGTVKSVGQLANSQWFSASKNYEVMVTIDSFPADVRLKPGMTAEVEIKIGTYNDVVAVPVSAVTEHFQRSYAYVERGNTFVRQPVEIGRTTTSFVEITKGLTPGDTVAMDAYQRGLAEFGDAERQLQGDTKSSDGQPATAVAETTASDVATEPAAAATAAAAPATEATIVETPASADSASADSADHDATNPPSETAPAATPSDAASGSDAPSNQ